MTRGNQRGVAMLFVLASVILSACAQLFMKASMIELQAVDVWHLAAAYPAELPAWLPVIAWGVAGLGCYALSLIFWVVASQSGWDSGGKQYKLDPSVRQSPGGYRSFFFWHSGYQAGK